jgi:hypothetical protein
MKVKVYVPRVVIIPDAELPRLAKRARAKWSKRYSFGVGVHELVEEARLAGLIDVPEDHSTELDDERVFLCGRLMSFREKFDHWRRQREARKARRKQS